MKDMFLQNRDDQGMAALLGVTSKCFSRPKRRLFLGTPKEVGRPLSAQVKISGFPKSAATSVPWRLQP